MGAVTKTPAKKYPLNRPKRLGPCDREDDGDGEFGSRLVIAFDRPAAGCCTAALSELYRRVAERQSRTIMNLFMLERPFIESI